MIRTALHTLPRSWPFLFTTGLAMALFAPTWIRLFDIWLKFEQNLAHGLPTFILYLGLLMLHPPQGADANPRFRTTSAGWPLWGSLVLVAVTLSWALLELVNIDTLSFLMLPVGVAAVTWAMLGKAAMVRLIPHLLVLALSLPFWGDLIPPLIALASVAVGHLVDRIGMTALIEGSSITLPYGRLVIADGCSGIRYFAISILLGATIALLNDYRWRGWTAAVLIAGMLGILSNWVRITGLVIIGYRSEMQSALMNDHEAYGWLIYAVFALPALYLAPVKRRQGQESRKVHTLDHKGWAAVAIAALCGPVLLAFTQGSVESRPDWVVSNERFMPRDHGSMPLPLTLPDRLRQAQYFDRQEGVWLNLAQYQRHHSGEKLVPYIGTPFDKERWQPVSNTETAPYEAVHLYRDVARQRQVAITQWYKVGRFSTEDYRLAKLLQIPSTLLNDNRFALVTLQADCRTPTCAQEIEQLATSATQLRLEAGAL